MNQKLISLWILALFAGPMLMDSAFGQQTIKISGWIYDAANSGLADVVVSAYYGVENLATSDKTKPDGYYELEVPIEGKSISKLEYVVDGYDYESLPHLSGSKDHSISKILYKHGEARPFVAAISTLESYETTLFFALNSPKLEQAKAELRKQKLSTNVADVKVLGDVQPEAMRRFRDKQERLTSDFRDVEK